MRQFFNKTNAIIVTCIAAATLLAKLLESKIESSNMLKSALSSVTGFMSQVYNGITYKITIPLWVLVPLVFIVPLIYLAYLKIDNKISKIKKYREEMEGFRGHYLTDVFNGIRFRWRYKDDEILSVRAYCPKCDEMFMVASQYSGEYKCKNCGASYNLPRPVDIRKKIVKQISDVYGEYEAKSLDTIWQLGDKHRW